MRGNSSSQEGLSCSGRSEEQTSLRWGDAHPLEQLRVHQWQLDNLPEFSDLLGQSADLGVTDVSRVFGGHVVDEWINFAWKVPGWVSDDHES